jgi:hypothetical protein
MQANAVRGQLDRKRRGMRAILGKSGCECAVNYCEDPARKMLMNDHYSLGNTSRASFNPRFYAGWEHPFFAHQPEGIQVRRA